VSLLRPVYISGNIKYCSRKRKLSTKNTGNKRLPKKLLVEQYRKRTYPQFGMEKFVDITDYNLLVKANQIQIYRLYRG